MTTFHRVATTHRESSLAVALLVAFGAGKTQNGGCPIVGCRFWLSMCRVNGILAQSSLALSGGHPMAVQADHDKVGPQSAQDSSTNLRAHSVHNIVSNKSN